MADQEIFLERRTPEIQVAILESQVLGDVDFIFDLKGRSFGFRQNMNVRAGDFNLTRFELGVGHALGAAAHFAFAPNHILTPDGSSTSMGIRTPRKLRVKYDLRQPVTVPQVGEDHTSVIPALGHPSAEGDFTIQVGCIELAASMCTSCFGRRHLMLIP